VIDTGDSVVAGFASGVRSKWFSPTCVFESDVFTSLRTVLGANKPLPTTLHHVQYRVSVERPLRLAPDMFKVLGQAAHERGRVIRGGRIDEITGRYHATRSEQTQLDTFAANHIAGQDSANNGDKALAMAAKLVAPLPYTGPGAPPATSRWRRQHAGGGPPVERPWTSSPAFAPGAVVQVAALKRIPGQ